MAKAQEEGFIVQSNIKNGVKQLKKLKNKKRGILARAAEKINASQAEQEK